MTPTVQPEPLISAWEPKSLYDKAERYIQQAQAVDKDQWDYALWTSLSLELLARAALANVHPALLAEPDRDGVNLASALGFAPVAPKFIPKSVAVSEVFRRLALMLPDFLEEHKTFGIQHTGQRNSELHSGEMAFDGVKVSSWQPRFYSTCAALLRSMGMTLEQFVGAQEAKAAEEVMAAAADESAKAVKGDVQTHRAAWDALSDPERQTLAAKAEIWATRQAGHRVNCPACGSVALVFGRPVSAATRKIEDDVIIEKQEYLPTHFECVACRLKINALSRLTVVELADRYVNTQEYDAAEYYGAAQDEWDGYEEDNNER